MNTQILRWLQARVDALDDWDVGGGIVLASDLAGHIQSHTGTKAWNSGAGHEPSPIGRILLTIYAEIGQYYQAHLRNGGNAASTRLGAAQLEFERNPTLLKLVPVAEAINAVCSLIITDEQNQLETDDGEIEEVWDDE